jgi:hypothetical protein
MRRKLTYIAHLKEASDNTLLVSVCDKLHNARAIVQDVEAGFDVFLAKLFTQGNLPVVR